MKYPRLMSLLIICCLFLTQLSACSLLESGIATSKIQDDYPRAEVVFQVNLPEPLPEDTKMVIEVLDDVTGLYFNSSRFEMAKTDDLNYFIRLPFVISSEVKYRYIRSGTTSEYEFNSNDQQVRYRILRVEGPEIVQDLISTWIGQPYSGARGRILGQAIDKSNQAPIPNLLVCVGGFQTITASDGTFIFEGLKPGIQNLIMYSMDGAYETFQQGALIADGATTPVTVFLNKRATTEVSFIVKIPSNVEKIYPVRFVSNLLTLGNAYGDLLSGSAGSAANYPVMSQVSPGHYLVKLTLPVGAYIRYKYSLGDGFWNSELDKNGRFVVRDLIVNQPQTINDEVTSFIAENSAPVEINLTVPPTTPSSEQVFLQLNPFDWMEPLPMVSTAENSWKYTIYNPMHLLGEIKYQFCRNGQCSLANDLQTVDNTFLATSTEQIINKSISSWNSLSTDLTHPEIFTDGGPSQPRPDFVAGIEVSSEYSPIWETSIDQGLSAAYAMGGDWVILTPTWSTSQGFLPLLKPLPGKDLLWNDLQKMTRHVTLNKQKTILFPIVNYTQSNEIFWNSAGYDSAWWDSWYEKYQRFILNNADLANMLGISSIILGDPSVIASMGGGKLPNGELSAPPSDADARWRQLITDVRARFSGNVLGVALIDSDGEFVPAWLDSVDAVYVIFSPAITNMENAQVSDIRSQIDSVLQEKVEPISRKFEKSIFLGVAYPSNNTAADGYSTTNIFRLTFPSDTMAADADLDAQSRIYNAIILSAASTDWINGFFSRGYYPYVSLQDSSSSIYQKPASEILWFWFHFLLNKAP